MLEHRALGASDLAVSVLSLGSWRTYERITPEAGAALLRQAREDGIDLLEVARYDDESGAAPIRTGYSEVCFGEAFRASGWPRDEVIVANKLWWEFWPQQTAADELVASLARTGLDRFDYLYSDPLPAELAIDDAVAAIGALIAAGTIRAWGVVNWDAEQIARSTVSARAQGVPPPSAAQLSYSISRPTPVEAAEMRAALAEGATSIVASYSLVGGILSGKYLRPGATGRMVGEPENPRIARAHAIAPRLGELAAEWGTTAAALALAYAIANPDVASVLFGATSAEQVRENVAAARVAETLTAGQRAQLAALAA